MSKVKYPKNLRLNIDPEFLAQFDIAAGSRGILNRSEAIRRAMKKWMENGSKNRTKNHQNR